MIQTSNRILKGWYLYDWANSAYVTSILTVFFGPFITELSGKIANRDGLINFLGLNVYSESLYPYLVTVSVLMQFLLLPAIGSYIDLKGNKVKFLLILASIGSLLTFLFFFFGEKTIEFLSISFVLSNFFFGASVVVYNSLLTQICPPEQRDLISSKGWAIGYIGGGLNLGLNLIILFFHDYFGVSQQTAVRLTFISTALWWFLFTLVSFYLLRGIHSESLSISNQRPSVLKNLLKTSRELLKNKNALLFLLAYLFFNDGVQTVIVISTQFGRRELNLSIEFLVVVILLVQFLAYFGTHLIAKVTEKLGSKTTLISCLVIWNLIVIYSFFLLRNSVGFVGLAFLISLVLGGTQALSRSIFSNLIAESKSTEYFSFYEISEKGSSWIGPFVFGLVLQVTKSYRFAILSLILFFFVGMILISFVNIPSLNNKEQG
jgi:UMF1 family MFS transporter